MNILKQAEQVAKDRWQATAELNELLEEETGGKEIEDNIADRLTRQSIEKNPGWELATVYSYQCYEDFHAICVVLWKQKGERDGFAVVGLRVCLYEQNPDGEYVLKRIERMG